MEAAASRLNLQRVRELLAQLAIEAEDPPPDSADVAAQVLDAWISRTCATALRELDRHRKTPAAAGRPLEPVRHLLLGLERMSAREQALLENLAQEAREVLRLYVDELPLRLLAQCRTTVAAMTPGVSDDAAAFSERVRRRLVADLRAVTRVTAVTMCRDLLAHAATGVQSLYPIACSADELLRLAPQASSAGTTFADPPLVTRLRECRARLQSAVDALAASGRLEADFQVGVLSQSLGGRCIVAVDDALRAAGSSGGSSVLEWKARLCEVAQRAARRAYDEEMAVILRAVDEQVSDTFAQAQRELDEWLRDAREWWVEACGGAEAADEPLAAVRFELLVIGRQAGGEQRLQELPA